ncbi:MAG: cellulase family glycosylhydrolase [Rhodopila sp.]|jgi:hypothetical protein
MPAVVCEYSGRTLIAQSVKWQFIGVLLMICHVLLVKVSMAFYPLVMVLIGWLYVRASLAAVLVFFEVLLYQNVIISISDTDMDHITYSALQGTNFIVLMVMGTLAGLRLLQQRSQHRAIFVSVIVALSFAVVYTLYGMASAGTTAAMIYFRSITGTAFAAVVGLDVGRVWSFRTISLGLIYASVISLMLSLIEYFFPIDYYTMINGVRYLQLKYWNAPRPDTFYTPQDIVRQFTSVFFNISGSSHDEYGFDNFRFGGTIMNPISNAYILGVLSVVTVALKRSVWLLLLVPMLALPGVKGAVILLLVSLTLYWFWIMVRDRRLLAIVAVCLSVCYIGEGIYFGLERGDYHVLGFLGGVRSLVHTPIGHGIGVGGNQSPKAANTKLANESDYANLDFAIESAVGVLMYQMGVASAAILGVFVTLLCKAPLGLSQASPLPRRSDIMFFALGMIALNGVFQEEAYAPYAAGLIMLLASVLVGNQRQDGHVLVPGSRRMRYSTDRRLVAGAIAGLVILAECGSAGAVPPERLQILGRGVNIATQFEQNGDLTSEINQLAAVGFRHVRVFILLDSLDDPAYLHRIDRLVAVTTTHRIGLILCMTSKTHLWTDQKDVSAFWLTGWIKLAERLRTSSPGYVFLELANEPGLSNSQHWDQVQSRLRQTVRDILPQHTILLTGSPTSTVWALVDDPIDVSQDTNIAYSFHLYQPMAVTCQGCACCPQYQSLRGLEYPPNETNIRRMTTPAQTRTLKNYRDTGAVMLVHEIDVASEWSAAHHVPVLATEFGIFSAASQSTRAAWLLEARSRLEDAHIGWTVWEWKGGFGVAPLLPHAPLTEALGLND